MPTSKHPLVSLLLMASILASLLIHGVAWSGNQIERNNVSPSEKKLHFEKSIDGWKHEERSRRMMIGSVAPTCTFNECRGCKYKCRAEQVPVESNDPLHSPYHYRCVCHI